NKIVRDISITVLEKRVNGKKTLEDKPDLLDGEKYDIATQIAKKIGKLLDKALYSKFKER
ncbi:MAG: hypothetical protein ACW99L_14385, partial [Promethearchaeota archaeon]